jgi:hypothetical protein
LRADEGHRSRRFTIVEIVVHSVQCRVDGLDAQGLWMQIVVSIVGILMMTAPAYYGSLSKNADKAPKAKQVIALTS